MCFNVHLPTVGKTHGYSLKGDLILEFLLEIGENVVVVAGLQNYCLTLYNLMDYSILGSITALF